MGVRHGHHPVAPPKGGADRITVAHFKDRGLTYDDALSRLSDAPGPLLLMPPTELAAALCRELDSCNGLRMGWEAVADGTLLALLHRDAADRCLWDAPFPPLSRTRYANHRGQFLWQEPPGSPLLLLVITTRGDLEGVLGGTPTHLYRAAPAPRPPLPAPEARDGVHAFLRTQEVIAITGVHLVWLHPASPDDPRRPRAPSPALDWELWRGDWAAWLARLPPQCQWMTANL